ncbi:MAG: sodium:solute symporter family protein [Pedosphaera sp.]|nr:sodium:solute symporter family protein [Pedosphaera sp.]
MIFFAASTIPLWVVLGYLVLLLGLGIYSGTFFRGTSKDYFVASRSIGPFMLLMSVFGTTMTGFALVGSTGKAFTTGVATYGALAAWSGIVHSAVFFVIGMRLWAIGKRHGYVTQVQFFRARFNSKTLGTVLFVLLVLLIIPYLLIGIISAGKFVQGTTRGMLGEAGIAPWLTSLVICGVVLSYVFLGGMRSAVWANTFQTIIFMLTGIIAFVMISKAVAEKTDGGSGNIIENVKRATEYVEIHKPERLVRGIHPSAVERHEEAMETFGEAETEYLTNMEMWKAMAEAGPEAAGAKPEKPTEPEPPKPAMSHLVFITFLFIPLSVGMFPHVFQHWLTAKSAKSFRLAIVAHPICIAIVWLPCILIGVWAAGLAAAGELTVPNSNATLGVMVGQLVDNPWLMGLLMAGVLAAIMSSLDSQFACLGTMFTNDIVIPIKGEDYYSDADKVKLARCFVVGVVAVAYVLSLLLANSSVFNLGVWCFSGFTALFPILFAALYWKRVTVVGAYACIGVTTVLWFYWFQQSGWGSDKGYSVLGMLPVAPLTLASTTALIAGSLLSRPPENRLVNRFFPRASSDGRGGD